MGKVQETMVKIMIDRIEARRAAGEDVVAPWRKPWDPATGMPRNLISNKPYRGANVWMTMMAPFASPYWVTRNQVKKLGGSIKKAFNADGTPTMRSKRTRNGEKEYHASEPYTPILFWSFPTPEEKAEGKFPFCRYYQVWNVEQVEGIEHSRLNAEPEAVNEIEEADAILKGYSEAPEVFHGGARACYMPSSDRVNMPPKAAFDSPEAYYRALFHELAHSTGHRNRLERDGVANPIKYASHAYSEEELIAEMAATMLAGFTGVGSPEHDENSAAYLDFWLTKMAADPNLLFSAGGASQKAIDHIRGIKWEKATETAEE